MTITLDSLHGRVTDLDSHEQMPVAMYGEVFGERFAVELESLPATARYPADPGPDDMEITPETVWSYKGPVAPGAADFDRRPEVLDTMGISRQLVFTGFCLHHFSSAQGGGWYGGAPFATPEEIEKGLAAVKAYNEWAAGIAQKYGDRLRMAGLLASGKAGLTFQGLMQEAEALVGMGIPVVMMSSGKPPAGLSPANPEMDPFWRMLAEEDVPVVFHAGCGTGFRSSVAWEQGVPQFGMGSFDDEIPGELGGQAEMNAGPSIVLNAYVAEQNFLSIMVLGGVFERHPTLRVGAIEMGSGWIGPLGERMDLMTHKDRHHPWNGGHSLSMRPSEYLNRHVRVTPYVYEPVERYVERWPEIQDTLCYTTDYPHFEGNKWSLKRFYDRLAPLGDEFLEKYFVTNGDLLLP